MLNSYPIKSLQEQSDIHRSSVSSVSYSYSHKRCLLLLFYLVELVKQTRATYAADRTATASKTVECNAKLGRIRCRSTRSSFLTVRTVSYQFSAYAFRRTSFGEPAVCSSLLKDVSMQLSYTVIKLPFSLRTRVMLSAKVMRQLAAGDTFSLATCAKM